MGCLTGPRTGPLRQPGDDDGLAGILGNAFALCAASSRAVLVWCFSFSYLPEWVVHGPLAILVSLGAQPPWGGRVEPLRGQQSLKGCELVFGRDALPRVAGVSFAPAVQAPTVTAAVLRVSLTAVSGHGVSPSRAGGSPATRQGVLVIRSVQKRGVASGTLQEGSAHRGLTHACQGWQAAPHMRGETLGEVLDSRRERTPAAP